MVNRFKLLLASMFIVGMMSSFASQADYEDGNCQYLPGFTPSTTEVSFGSEIVVPKDHPMGTNIKEITLNQIDNKDYVASCDRLVSTSWDQPDFNRANYNSDAIYESGVPGIGIRINNWAATDYGIAWFPRKSYSPRTCAPPLDQSVDKIYYCGRTWGYLSVQLVKIAPTTGTGTTPRIFLTRARLGHSSRIHTFYLGKTKIITPTPSCSLTHKVTRVNMGKFKTSEFRGINSATRSRDFNLELDCDANAEITMRLDGRPATNSYQNKVWALDHNSNNVTAKGVGLQIILRSRRRLLSIGESIVINPSDQVRHFSLPMQARYVQTEPRITPGKANVTATVTLTYQ